MSFSASSTCEDVLEGKRLDGRYAVITGGSAGLGNLTVDGRQRRVCARDCDQVLRAGGWH